jgi:DNA-directed RNA polymerase subunit M/transcription elongation factor TFIIS
MAAHIMKLFNVLSGSMFGDMDIYDRMTVSRIIVKCTEKKHTNILGEFNKVSFDVDFYNIHINLDPFSNMNKGDDTVVRSIFLFTLIYIQSFKLMGKKCIPLMSKLNNPRIGIIDIRQMPHISIHMLNYKNNQEHFRTLEMKENETIKVKTTSLYMCHKCKQRKTVVFVAQTRSGDEPNTIFVECVICGNKWRHS